MHLLLFALTLTAMLCCIVSAVPTPSEVDYFKDIVEDTASSAAQLLSADAGAAHEQESIREARQARFFGGGFRRPFGGGGFRRPFGGGGFGGRPFGGGGFGGRPFGGSGFGGRPFGGGGYGSPFGGFFG